MLHQEPSEEPDDQLIGLENLCLDNVFGTEGEDHIVVGFRPVERPCVLQLTRCINRVCHQVSPSVWALHIWI